MATEYFDTLYPSQIEGSIKEPLIKDPDGTPNRVLELDRPWRVEINWQLKSSNPATYPVDMIDGTWHVQVSVESLGIGFEGIVAEDDVLVSSFISGTTAQRDWKKEFTIPVGKVKDEAVYQLVTLITFKDTSGTRRAMAGFMEGPLITFYHDEP